MVWGVKSDGTMGWIQISDGYVGKIDFPTFIVRPNHVKLEGKELLRSDYPKLWAFAEENNLVVAEAEWQKIDATTKLQTNSGLFSSGNGTTTFRLPDHRGFFYRVLDDGRGVDKVNNRQLGMIQNSENNKHYHHQGYSHNASFGGGRFGTDWGFADAPEDSYGKVSQGSAPRTSTVGSESRPVNVGLFATIQYQ